MLFYLELFEKVVEKNGKWVYYVVESGKKW